MKYQRTIIGITGVFFAVGFAASQASAGGDPSGCNFALEINALRGGSPTVTVGSTKNITAKARIQKGTATTDTTIDVTLRIEAIDGTTVIDTQRSSGLIRLGVGKGGHGEKLAMNIPSCVRGQILFVATFFGLDTGDDLCQVTRRIVKSCKL